MSITVKYLSDIEPITQVKNSDWIDLRSAEHIWLKKGEYYEIKLGLAMKLPNGFEAIVVPRSSLYKKFGVIMANSVGIIDNSYCGEEDEWHLPVIALRDTFIPFDARICQFRIQKNMGKIDIEALLDSEHLPNKNRGGLGSTGYK